MSTTLGHFINGTDVADDNRPLPVNLGYPHAKGRSRQTAHLDQVVELNMLQHPGKSTVCVQRMVGGRSVFGFHLGINWSQHGSGQFPFSLPFPGHNDQFVKVFGFLNKADHDQPVIDHDPGKTDNTDQ